MLDEFEYQRWMRSARLTLKSARKDLDGGEYSWACFKAHQAAEKAIKSLLWGTGSPSFGHSLPILLQRLVELGLEVPERIRENAVRLSKYYTTTRYPDVWSEGIPEDYYVRGEAEEAISYAEDVLRWVERTWKSLEKGSS